jgi:hypothetical protein
LLVETAIVRGGLVDEADFQDRIEPLHDGGFPFLENLKLGCGARHRREKNNKLWTFQIPHV